MQRRSLRWTSGSNDVDNDRDDFDLFRLPARTQVAGHVILDVDDLAADAYSASNVQARAEQADTGQLGLALAVQ